MESLLILFLACLNLPLTEQKPSYLITAPNVLHVGMNEAITVQALDASRRVDVTVYFTRPVDESFDEVVSQEYSVELNPMNNFTQVVFAQIMPEKTMHLDFTSSEQYVTLTAKISKEVIRRAWIHLSPRPYFIYVVTDKPIYHLHEPVRYQIFTFDQERNPINSAVTVEVLNSWGSVLASVHELHNFSPVHSGEIIFHSYLTGRYQIRAKVSESSEYQGVALFQVWKYGAFPKFDVRLIPERSYYVVTEHSFRFKIQVRNNLYGHLFVRVTYGMSTRAGQRTVLSTLSPAYQISNGTANVILSSNQLIKSINENGGMDKFKTNTLYIAAEVTDGTGHREIKTLDGIPFLLSPYNITLITNPYFIPGAPFQFLMSVTFHDGAPASGVHFQVSINMSATQTFNAAGKTDKIGEQGFEFNVPWSAQYMKIQVTVGDNSTGYEKIHRTVKKYHSLSNKYLQINVPFALFYPGDIITVELQAISQQAIRSVRYYSYMVLGRGKVLDYRRVEWAPVVTINLPITRDMIPYFHIVAYYVICDDGRQEIITNSELIKVESLCDVKFKVDSAWKTHAGHNELSLKVLSESPAKVFVHAVDTRLKEMTAQGTIDMRKVFEDLTSYNLVSASRSGINNVGVFHDSGLHPVSDLLTPLPQPEVYRQLKNRTVSGSSVRLTCDIHHSSSKPIHFPRSSLRYVSRRKAVTIKPKELEIGADDELISPTFDNSPMWSFSVRPGNKVFRLMTNIDPSNVWEINVLSLSSVEELCIAKPMKLTPNDAFDD